MRVAVTVILGISALHSLAWSKGGVGEFQPFAPAANVLPAPGPASPIPPHSELVPQLLPLPVPMTGEVYWRLRARAIDIRTNEEIAWRKAQLVRLLRLRFDLTPEDFLGVAVEMPPDDTILPLEILELRTGIEQLKKEAAEEREALRDEGRRNRALPGWFRPLPPNSPMHTKLDEAWKAKERQAALWAEEEAEREARAPRDEEYWRRLFASHRAEIGALTEELHDIEQALDLTRMRRLQYSPHPNYPFDYFYLALAGDLEDRMIEVNRQRNAAKISLAQAQEELRRSGGLPGWMR